MNILNYIKSSLIPLFNVAQFIRPKHRRILLIGIIAMACFALYKYQNHRKIAPIAGENIKLLCVHYDAGEANAMLPVLKQLEVENVNFRVLVIGTAETIIKPEMFKGRRLTLKDLQIDAVVDNTTARTIALSETWLRKFQKIKPKVVLVGSTSRIQQQILEYYNRAVTVAFIDDFSYDRQQESFSTVVNVQAIAKHVLCPSQQTVKLFSQDQKNAKAQPEYHVIGKPSLEVWRKEIASVDRSEILKKLNFTNDQPVITFIGGYGPGYDVINPLFDECGKRLQKLGYQVIQQPHPKIALQKIKTTEALAISKYVVGYNSSVILDAALVGIPSLFFIPDSPKTQFKHFAIDAHLIGKATAYEELVFFLSSNTVRTDIGKTIGVPQESISIVKQFLYRWMNDTH